MKAIRDFLAVFRRELERFSDYKTFFRLSVGLPILSFVIFILLFRTGVPHDIPIAIYDPGNTPLSRQLGRMIDATPSAKVAYHISDFAQGEKMMKEGKIEAIVSIPRDLEKDIYSNTQATVTAYINGLNLVKNGMLNRDIQTVITTFSSGIQIQTLMKHGVSEKEAYDLMMPIYFEKHILFNPFSNYEYYLLPSFLPLMLMLFTLLTTIFTIGVELKNSTTTEWLATGGGNILVALTGKLLPYTVIFFALCMLMNTCLFKFLGVPLQGNVLLMFVSGLIYVMGSQAIGVFMIAVLSNLRLALSIGGGYSVLSFTFSGLTFPFMAMDWPLQLFGRLFPMTYYVEIFIDQAMRGAPAINSLAYLGYMMLFLLLPLIMLPRLKRICTEEKFWGRL